MNRNLFYSYSAYLKKRYGVPAFRVGVDAGFSCPNRDGGRQSPGCSYCDAFGARAMYQRTQDAFEDAPLADLFADIAVQTEKATAFLKKRYRAEVFLLYFQAFSGTYAPVERLKEIYDYSLSLNPYSELIVSTRPDCVDEDVADLLASYRGKGLDVWVELGLQSAHNKTLERINRGHSVEDFEKAFNLLRSRGIKIAVHLIFGLPGESEEDIFASCEYTASLHPEGVKFHNLHIPVNSPLYREFQKGEVDAPDTAMHLEYTIGAIERMPLETMIMRLTCDSSSSQLAAPLGFMKKTEFYDLVRRELSARKTFQGRLFKTDLL